MQFKKIHLFWKDCVKTNTEKPRSIDSACNKILTPKNYLESPNFSVTFLFFNELAPPTNFFTTGFAFNYTSSGEFFERKIF
jgi:hypothetical protein